LTPQKIRRIREQLGLSQVEAGEFLGGGPRAFTKYEGGTTKPAAAVMNILRLLDSDPGALNTLTGRKAVPIENDSTKPGEVTGPHVAALGERKFANLTRRLLSAEAFGGGLPMDGIHVAANITAPDGGEDASIEWQEGPERTAFLPNRLSQFQLKAGKITPGKAGAEVLDVAGNVKGMIRAALGAGGTYIMLCAESYTKKEIQKREGEIRKSLRAAGLMIDERQVQFRDADQIAFWVNSHRAVAVWLLEQTQPGLIGPFRDWTHWAGRYEHDSSPWVDDPRLPPFRNKLRELVTLPRGVARIVGLSGVGKSRLALEALGATGEEESLRPRLSDIVLYAAESEAGPAVIKSTVQNLADAAVRALIVVDRCEAQTHQDLAAMVKRSGSLLSLVTIDDEIPEGPTLPQDTLKVGSAPETVIDTMLKHLELPSEDHRRLMRFSGGFPQLAALIGRSWMNDEPIASASDTTLIQRIILGRKPQNPALLDETAMLLGAFRLIGTQPPVDEDLTHVARLSLNRTPDELRAAIDNLERRGVVQRRGRLAALQPRLIAVTLAERQWGHWSPQVWDDVLTGTVPDHLRTRAADQLTLLNTTSVATQIVRHVCRVNGPLNSIAGLSEPKNAEILSSLAEIDAQAVITLLEFVLDPLSADELKNVDGDVRRHLVWALGKIAFRFDTFDRGAAMLLRLAVAENEQWRNNATGQYTDLFPVLEGNTEAGPDARLRALDDALNSSHPSQLRIVVDALLAGAKTDFFSRFVGAETHGARRALKPWQPRLWEDAWDYVSKCLDRLAGLATRSDEIGERARIGLGHGFRSLASRGLIDLVEKLLATVTAAHGPYWPQALSGLGDVLAYDTNGLDPEVEKRVRVLVKALTPNELADRVRFLVTEMPWDYPVDERLDFDAQQARQFAAVEQLVLDLLKQPEALAGFLPQLSRGEQRMSLAFGRALAEKGPDPLFWREPILGAAASAPTDERNYGLLTGYFTGLSKRVPKAVAAFKQEASRSEVFAPALPLVCLHIGIKADDVGLVCGALVAGLIQPFVLMKWKLGGVLAKLPPNAVAPLLDQLFAMEDRAFSVGIEVLGMYVHGRQDRLESLRPQLRLAAGFAGRMSGRRHSGMDTHHFEELMRWILAKGRRDRDAVSVAMTLTKHLIVDADYERDEVLKPLLPQLLSEFSEVVWPLLGQAIVANRKNAWRFEHMLGDKYSFSNQNPNPAAMTLPENMLLAWAHAHPDVAPAFLAAIVPALTSRNPDAGEQTWHPMMKRLLDEFGDREDVLRALTRNMCTFGWTGSRATYFALYSGPLRELQSHPIGAVRRWAEKMGAHFEREIAAARNEDAELHAHWDL
jgi:transcriptional regulator with XRE-family HTH domain